MPKATPTYLKSGHKKTCSKGDTFFKTLGVVKECMLLLQCDPLDPELFEGGVSDEQLDTTIRMRDTDALGQSFDSMSALLTKLSLTPAEATMVNRTADKKGNQAGLAHALHLWLNANPSKATYRTLLEIAESLRRDTTSQICKYYHVHVDTFWTKLYKL